MTTIKLTPAAQANVDETGTDVDVDVKLIQLGLLTPKQLLDQCLEDADDDRARGWREYVYAVADEAGKVRASK